MERGLNGERVPVYHRGRLVGERIRHHNGLIMAVLNAMDRRAERLGSSDPAAALERYLGSLGSGGEGSTEK
jgi:hypothetical protein